MAQEQDDPALMIRSLQPFGRHAPLFGRYRDHASTRKAQCSDLALRKRTVSCGRRSNRPLSPVCALGRNPSGISERLSLAEAAISEAISLAKELKDMHALALALQWATNLAYAERNPADVDRLASESIELSTRYSFPHSASPRSHSSWLGAECFRRHR